MNQEHYVGMEILRRHYDIFGDWKTRRMFFVYIEQIISIIWALCWLAMLIILICNYIVLGEWIALPYIWKSLFLSVVCLIQFAIAMLLDSRYDKNLVKNAVTAIWYPFLYWYVNALIVIASLPALFRKRKKTATWNSPDRGL